MIKYINKDNILKITKNMQSDKTVVTDNEVIKQLFDKYNSAVKVEYSSRKYLKEVISELKPDAVILLFHGPNTISYINSMLPNTHIYTLEISEEDKIINGYVEELESLTA